ncbi:MAG: hypothetical protein ACT4PU_13910 [Planctomycetota bacterium]
MRKLFIGCGVIVLLALAGFGYVAYRAYPHVVKMQEQWTAGFEALTALESRFPFEQDAQTQLDTRRFVAMLDLRVGLTEYLAGIDRAASALHEPDAAGEEPGMFEMWGQLVDLMSPSLKEFATRLEAAEMSWSEFAWHTRVMWSALKSVEGGADEPALAALAADSYTRFKESYERSARDLKDLKTLDVLLDDIPPTVKADARAMMAADVERMRAALQIVAIDYIYMDPKYRIEDLAVRPGFPAVVPTETNGADPPK